ncbi:SPOR domain-containing protein [Aquabacterium sp.]|uniref:SPOR domain-containing protein n=1 Tax=Aquabacterium sp. TaxID=1872578 RepID=UPI0039C85FE9
MKSQRGGFFLGMIVGLLIGLAMALAVALYVTKVPLPFVDKVPQRTAEQDAAEAEHNKNWDPNAPLYGANPAKPKAVPKPVLEEIASEPLAAASAPAADEAASAGVSPASAARAAKAASATAPAVRNPAAILSGEAVSTNPPADPLTYYVQAGAYGSSAEAEQQRAKLSMMGMEPRISEREVNGRTMYRVRVGPFSQREQAEEARVKLSGSGIDSALVRIQK